MRSLFLSGNSCFQLRIAVKELTLDEAAKIDEAIT